MKFFWIFAFVLVSAASFHFAGNFPVMPADGQGLVNIKDKLAGIFFVASTSGEKLMEKYTAAQSGDTPVRLLIVPGHDDSSVGAQFKNVKEADLNAELAKYLAAYFKEEKGFEVLLTRTQTGYTPEFASYFESNGSSILDFANAYRAYMKSSVESGIVSRYIGVQHNDAPKSTVIKLYGINKWANENNVDLVIHVHFNDHAGRPSNQAGRYSGFAIYVPERQFSNSQASAAIGRNIFNRLNAYNAPSDLPQESSGIVEEQELVAIGSNNSLDPAGMLIEYDYIYEPQFQYKTTRKKILGELAFQTYYGIKDFFDGSIPLTTGGAASAAGFPETTLLPHQWNADLWEGMVGSTDVLSLQAALMREGFYPPPGFTRNNCPITGNFGKCTVSALKKFQEKHGIKPTGYFGSQTRKVLNEVHGAQ